jgi:hypothetical protein
MPSFGQNRAEAIKVVLERVREAYLVAQQGSVFGDAYRDKEDEATRWFAAQTPNPANFPFIRAETGITAATEAEVATAFRQAGVARRVKWAELETIRATFAKALQDATSYAQVMSAALNVRQSLTAWTQANAPRVLDRVTEILTRND